MSAKAYLLRIIFWCIIGAYAVLMAHEINPDYIWCGAVVAIVCAVFAFVYEGHLFHNYG